LVRGNAETWVALTELPAEALGLVRNGYVQVQELGSSTWRVALTPEGLDLARSLF
jgi:hypothetical protein